MEPFLINQNVEWAPDHIANQLVLILCMHAWLAIATSKKSEFPIIMQQYTLCYYIRNIYIYYRFFKEITLMNKHMHSQLLFTVKAILYKHHALYSMQLVIVQWQPVMRMFINIFKHKCMSLDFCHYSYTHYIHKYFIFTVFQQSGG